MLKRWISNFLSGSTLMAIILFWVFLAPTTVGGNSEYLIITGNSMAPEFNVGDLVIIQPKAEYHVNDIIAFSDPNLNKTIFHRIIEADLDHFKLKGDNNTWVDSFQPQYSDIIGRLWLHIPKVGAWFSWFRTPVVLSITICGFFTVIVLMVVRKPVLNKRRVILQ